MNKVLIIEDNRIIAEQMQFGLNKRGLKCYIADDFNNIIKEAHFVNPDIILMDLYLPVYDGYYWTQRLREYSTVPIIFVSSAEEKLNTVAAISTGADDFIEKPFDLDVLNSKIQSWLRRTYRFDQASSYRQFNGYHLDLTHDTVALGDAKMNLTAHETIILQTLFENQGQVVSKRILMTAFWNNDRFVDENALQAALVRLRRKVAAIKLDHFLITKKGDGYFLGDVQEN